MVIPAEDDRFAPGIIMKLLFVLLGPVLSAVAFADPSPEAEKFLAVADSAKTSLGMEEKKFARALLPESAEEILDGFDWGNDGWLPRDFHGYALDLNGDGSQEYFVKTSGGGSGGPAYILVGKYRDRGGWKTLCDFQGVFHVLKAEEKSWPKLVAISKGGGGNFCKRHFEFENGAYVETLRENFRNGKIVTRVRPQT
jgi:hypothetical protein